MLIIVKDVGCEERYFIKRTSKCFRLSAFSKRTLNTGVNEKAEQRIYSALHSNDSICILDEFIARRVETRDTFTFYNTLN